MTSLSSTRLFHGRGDDVEYDIAIDVETHELDWVFTRGLAWYGYPELVARVPSDAPGEPGSLAVFLGAALITIGRQMLDLEGFVDVDEIPHHTDLFAGEPVTVWVSGHDDPDAPLPPRILVRDVLSARCSLWDAEP